MGPREPMEPMGPVGPHAHRPMPPAAQTLQATSNYPKTASKPLQTASSQNLVGEKGTRIIAGATRNHVEPTPKPVQTTSGQNLTKKAGSTIIRITGQHAPALRLLGFGRSERLQGLFHVSGIVKLIMESFSNANVCCLGLFRGTLPPQALWGSQGPQSSREPFCLRGFFCPWGSFRPWGPLRAHGAHGAHGPPWGPWGPWGSWLVGPMVPVGPLAHAASFKLLQTTSNHFGTTSKPLPTISNHFNP